VISEKPLLSGFSEITCHKVIIFPGKSRILTDFFARDVPELLALRGISGREWLNLAILGPGTVGRAKTQT